MSLPRTDTSARDGGAGASARGDGAAAPPVVIITGPHSNVGKTTLIERLVPLLSQRGTRVGTVKHTHCGFELDQPGKDSYRHGQAGAAATVLIGPDAAAMLLRDTPRLSLADACGVLTGRVDLILAEGFRESTGPAIVLDPAAGARLTRSPDTVTLGVLPDELTAEELASLVDICLSVGTPKRAAASERPGVGRD